MRSGPRAKSMNCSDAAGPAVRAHVINDIPDRGQTCIYVHTYVHHENRSHIQSLMRSAISYSQWI